jgi:ethanolamine ammonia-lyase small subunit
MGQAKNRGSFEERKAAAIIRNNQQQKLEEVKKSKRMEWLKLQNINKTKIRIETGGRGSNKTTESMLSFMLMNGLFKCEHLDHSTKY